jgi:hypothetical protein
MTGFTGTPATVFFSVTALTFIMVIATLLTGLPKRVYARVEASPGVPFELTFVSPRRRRTAVSMRFHVRYSGAGVSEDDYGIACDLTVRVDGAEVLRETVGAGNQLYVDPCRKISAFTWVSSTQVGSSYALKATVKLADLGVIEEGATLEVTGTVTCNRNTLADSISVWAGT